ncbi:unnamed protein product [Psylliodes chrysocephalus]|uniref:Uncharacterized protein n=1 Tax=Psylliodes chrysocephalus TaxID=3402493 RepID=A0A9P0CU41_9CUCU|nr:unnamed protein product [Psylliodes chrysocephala]
MSARNRRMVQECIERERNKTLPTSPVDISDPAYKIQENTQDSDVKKATLENKCDSVVEYGRTEERQEIMSIENFPCEVNQIGGSPQIIENQNTIIDMLASSNAQLLDISYNFVDHSKFNLPGCSFTDFTPNDSASAQMICGSSSNHTTTAPRNDSKEPSENEDISENDLYEDSGSSYVPDNEACSDEDDFDVEAHSSNSEAIQIEEEHNSTNNDEIKKGKKRLRQENKWKRNIIKKKRMGGQIYKSSKTKIDIKKRKIREACINCRVKCSEKISEAQRTKVHEEFWNEDISIDQKRQFLCLSILQIPVSRVRQRTFSREGKRLYTLKYYFLIDGEKIQVCRKYFLNTLDISQTFVRFALQKRQSSGMVECDKRGKQPSVNKIKDEDKNTIRQHIMSFPCEESHYSRRRTAKKYLGSHLNISTMYKLYREQRQLENIHPEDIPKQWIYSQIFNTEFNLAFAPPANDTFDACDEFVVNLRQAGSPIEREKIQTDYDSHLNEADKRYELKKQDKQLALDKPEEIVLMIDLQKCLPCPKLSNAQSFYSLKLWCFNYTIYDSSNKKANCLIWDESIAGRGGNEMASCLMSYINSISKTILTWRWIVSTP